MKGQPQPESERPFGVVSLTLLVVAGMIGSGVFTTSGFTLAAVGTPARVMICWLAGGLIAMAGAISYGQLARLLPESGGEYLYLSRHVHPLAGFLAGWVSLIAGFSGAIAIAAVAFERYALPDHLRPSFLPADTLAIGLILVCGLMHGSSVRGGSRVHNLIVVVKILALLGFLLVAATSIRSHTWHWRSQVGTVDDGNIPWGSMAVSVVWISLSYAGFNAAIYVTSESRQAQSTIPRALIFGTIAVTVLYLLLNLVFVTAQPPTELAGQRDVAAIAANAIGGPSLEWLVRVAICLGLVSSVSGMTVAGPRVYAKMAEDRVFPQWFRQPHRAIRRSVGLQIGISILLILTQRLLVTAGWLESSLQGLLDYLGTTLSLTSACCVATLLLPSVRAADSGRSRMVTAAAVLYVAGTLTAIVLMLTHHTIDGQRQTLQHLSGTALTIVSGGALWTILRRRRR